MSDRHEIDQITFAVVTRVPDPEQGGGNLAAAMDLWAQVEQPGESNSWLGRHEHATKHMGMAPITVLRVPVFSLGEVLLLDGNGREFAGQTRMPSKWDVSVEHFDTAEEAVARSQAIEEEFGKWLPEGRD